MFLRKYWLPVSVFLVAICAVGLYLLATQPPKEPIKIYKAVEPEKPTEQPTAKAPVGDTLQGGQVHADSTWHEGPHEPVAETPSEPQTAVMPDWTSLTDEERLQRKKAANQAIIDAIANIPAQAEVYKLMTENSFPYSPEVETQIHQANMRVTQKGVAYDKTAAEIEAKKRDPDISPREFGRLIRERQELRNRYKGGQ